MVRIPEIRRFDIRHAHGLRNYLASFFKPLQRRAATGPYAAFAFAESTVRTGSDTGHRPLVLTFLA